VIGNRRSDVPLTHTKIKESGLRISSRRDSEFYGRFEIAEKTYEVGTEDLGTGKCRIVTRIYMKGEILFTVTSDYAHLAGHPDLEGKIRALMVKQHESAKTTFITQHSKPEKSKARFAEEMKRHLKDGDSGAALDTARRALDQFPSDPFFLSHCGYLTAVAENKSKAGTKLCEEAISILRKSESTDTIFFLPLFYLHLGRAYMKGNRRKAALDAFQSGLKYDSGNRELLAEIKKLGIREAAVIPFLQRGNPVNIYLGKLRHRIRNRK
jgi:tetratricopeptide (TPR) repeat protein